MTATEASKITAAMREWAKRHPEPDEPMLFLAGESYSPRELADHVEKRAPVGLLQLQVFDFAMRSWAL